MTETTEFSYRPPLLEQLLALLVCGAISGCVLAVLVWKGALAKFLAGPLPSEGTLDYAIATGACFFPVVFFGGFALWAAACLAARVLPGRGATVLRLTPDDIRFVEGSLFKKAKTVPLRQIRTAYLVEIRGVMVRRMLRLGYGGKEAVICREWMPDKTGFERVCAAVEAAIGREIPLKERQAPGRPQL